MRSVPGPPMVQQLSVRARAFRAIYAGNRWRGTETRSGPGSTFGSTRRVREALQELVAMLEATSVLDAACGASFWMPDLPGYVGVDIVPDALGAVQQRFPTRRYELADICTDELPHAEVAIVRDVLAHLPTGDVLAALSNLRHAGVRWLLATTFVGADNAVDIRPGGYHELDMTSAPFFLGEPLQMIPDGYWEDELVYPTKYLGLFLCA